MTVEDLAERGDTDLQRHAFLVVDGRSELQDELGGNEVTRGAGLYEEVTDFLVVVTGEDLLALLQEVIRSLDVSQSPVILLEREVESLLYLR